MKEVRQGKKFRVRGISQEGRGAWYELGSYIAKDKREAEKLCQKDCRKERLLEGLKLEIDEVF